LRKAFSVLVARTGASCALFTAFCAWMTFETARLPYNGEGRHFDARDAVVTHESAPLGWGILLVSALVVTLALWWMARRIKPVSNGE